MKGLMKSDSVRENEVWCDRVTISLSPPVTCSNKTGLWALSLSAYKFIMTGVSKTRCFFRESIVNSAKRQNFLEKFVHRLAATQRPGVEWISASRKLWTLPRMGWGQFRHWPLSSPRSAVGDFRIHGQRPVKPILPAMFNRVAFDAVILLHGFLYLYDRHLHHDVKLLGLKDFFFATPKTGDQCSLSHQTNTLICPQPYMPCHIFSDRLVYFTFVVYYIKQIPRSRLSFRAT